MKIGLDFDGVFSDAGKLFVDAAERLFGVTIPTIKTAGRAIVDEGYLNSAQFSFLKDSIFEEDSFELKMVSGADLACRQLIARGHRLQILTKREKGAEVARNFCKQIGLDIPVLGTPAGKSKSEVSTDFDVFLDDSISNLKDLNAFVPNLFLFSWDYNSRESVPKHQRVSGWEEFARKIA